MAKKWITACLHEVYLYFNWWSEKQYSHVCSLIVATQVIREELGLPFLHLPITPQPSFSNYTLQVMDSFYQPVEWRWKEKGGSTGNKLVGYTVYLFITYPLQLSEMVLIVCVNIGWICHLYLPQSSRPLWGSSRSTGLQDPALAPWLHMSSLTRAPGSRAQTLWH